MADRSGERKQPKGKGRQGRKKPAKKARRRKPDGKQRANLISAIDHPLRRCVLRTLLDEDEPRSPNEIKGILGLELNSVSYHVRILLGFGCVKPAGERMARGAMEHFYRPAIESDPPIETLLEETREFDERTLGLRR